MLSLMVIATMWSCQNDLTDPDKDDLENQGTNQGQTQLSVGQYSLVVDGEAITGLEIETSSSGRVIAISQPVYVTNEGEFYTPNARVHGCEIESNSAESMYGYLVTSSAGEVTNGFSFYPKSITHSYLMSSTYVITASLSGTFTNEEGVTKTIAFSVVAQGKAPPSPDSYEPNNTIASASLLTIGVESPVLNLHVADDVDFFRFLALPGKTYSIETFIPSDSNIDTILTHYSSEGTYLDENDDWADGLESKIEVVNSSASNQLYYFKVSEFSEGEFGEDYTIKVTDITL